ncbi:unnamed protein product [Vicia faba]|uniref:Uncharacterized protein n=1 Tax=Vicia faba TaxID=3906 RepID=A0AAV1AXQ0_VICFA|nr:unnamed protein product [Vicia faba]
MEPFSFHQEQKLEQAMLETQVWGPNPLLWYGSDRVLNQLLVIPIATTAGLGGSIIDSLFGATLQFSGFCSILQKVVGKPGPTDKKISGLSNLDNNAVNFVLTMILTSIACLYIF